MHYRRHRAFGDAALSAKPTPRKYPQPRPRSVAWEAFKKRLRRTEAGCLVWTGCRDVNGYGRVYWDGKLRSAHRIAYTMEIGPIPDDMNVCHRCDNPPCCEKTHLFLGSHADNMRDMTTKGRGVSPPAPRGEKMWIAKVTEADVRTIRAAFAAGERRIAIAQRLGISKNIVYQVISGQSWRHVA